MNQEPAGLPVLEWVRRGDWTSVNTYFARKSPSTADEFAARALLRTLEDRSVAAGTSALADWRRACALQPDNLMYAVNLTQALLDEGEAREALDVALALRALAPRSCLVLEKLALALTAHDRWEEAGAVAQHACALAKAEGLKWSARVQAVWDDLATAWWRPVHLGALTLRLPEASDLPFLADCFRDADFMRRYHRFQGSEPADLRRFLWRAKRPPHEVRRRDWLVQGPQGRPLGLAALVDMDFGNSRAELLVGLPGVPRNLSLGLQATLAAMQFGFERLGLAKLVSHVYADNLEAQANTLHLGFVQEGLLRAHIQTSAGPVNLYVNGLLRDEYAAHPKLRKMLARWRYRAPLHKESADLLR
ncbi:GNAT family N-acetyltransferase [Inhella proteolytica]|uniref:GNAT family N-acetyltransferase n=1 Tax=Inhella proteolytica TaxID=2795029 RepID=A0A931NFI6_9BURK|nr:GNAT family protein [Inhella proteolytica]MBH9576136.1 GNAT family N-acetyltransferase [Inhella proteolytica]